MNHLDNLSYTSPRISPPHRHQPSHGDRERLAVKNDRSCGPIDHDRRRMERAFQRPSAISEDYVGPSGCAAAVSIHNLIERQSWETRMGYANTFDPSLRGYNMPRDTQCEDEFQRKRVPSRDHQRQDRYSNRWHGLTNTNRRPYNPHSNQLSRSRSRSRSRSPPRHHPRHISRRHHNFFDIHRPNHQRNYHPNQMHHRRYNSPSHFQCPPPPPAPPRASSPPIPTTQYIAPTERTKKFTTFILLLVGLPGSGKSTFAEMLQTVKPWKYVQVNQDQLGNRQKCENLTRKTLDEGRIPIIDRCNFDPTQRKHFLDIAAEFQVQVDCVVFTYEMEECIRRCERRGKHETMLPGDARKVVGCMVKQFCPPLPNRVNIEKFRNLKNVTDIQMSNDIGLEYLSDLY